LGRHVLRGEQGIAIIVPHHRKVTNDAGEEEQRVEMHFSAGFRCLGSQGSPFG